MYCQVFSFFLKSRKFSEMCIKGVIIINLISTVNNPSLFAYETENWNWKRKMDESWISIDDILQKLLHVVGQNCYLPSLTNRLCMRKAEICMTNLNTNTKASLRRLKKSKLIIKHRFFCVTIFKITCLNQFKEKEFRYISIKHVRRLEVFLQNCFY